MEATTPERLGVESERPNREPGMSRRWFLALTLVGVAAIVLVALAASGVRLGSGGDEDASDNLGVVFTIPYGTYQRVMQWNQPAVEFPPEIRFARGEVAAITIRNEDYLAYRVGPFVVGPGQTYTQRFPRPGTYVFDCAIEAADGMEGMTDGGGMESMGGVESILVVVEG
jgi:hypothetical protein